MLEPSEPVWTSKLLRGLVAIPDQGAQLGRNMSSHALIRDDVGQWEYSRYHLFSNTHAAPHIMPLSSWERGVRLVRLVRLVRDSHGRGERSKLIPLSPRLSFVTAIRTFLCWFVLVGGLLEWRAGDTTWQGHCKKRIIFRWNSQAASWEARVGTEVVWMIRLPSRELTYPVLKALLKMIFLFPRWDMLIPWRVIIAVD